MKPNFFTRDNGARDAVIDFTTEEVLVHMIKYADRAKFLSVEERVDENLINAYPFMNVFEGLSPLDFAMQSKENLRKIIKFFMYQRYGSGTYRKEKTDTEELFVSCEKSGHEIDESVGNIHRQK